jgi:hypothetical protein
MPRITEQTLRRGIVLEPACSACLHNHTGAPFLKSCHHPHAARQPCLLVPGSECAQRAHMLAAALCACAEHARAHYTALKMYGAYCRGRRPASAHTVPKASGPGVSCTHAQPTRSPQRYVHARSMSVCTIHTLCTVCVLYGTSVCPSRPVSAHALPGGRGPANMFAAAYRVCA